MQSRIIRSDVVSVLNWVSPMVQYYLPRNSNEQDRRFTILDLRLFLSLKAPDASMVYKFQSPDFDF